MGEELRTDLQLGRNLEAMRGHNSSLVVDLIRRNSGISRIELARTTGLVPQAISKIVARLLKAGVVVESGRVSGGIGKARTQLSVAPNSRHALGIHLDRAGWRMVLVNLAGQIESVIAAEFDEEPSPARVVELLGAAADQIVGRLGSARERVIACGLGMPGPLDHRRGLVTTPNNFFGWRNVPLAQLVADRIGIPVTLDKDINMATISEAWAWCTLRSGSTAVIYVGTGIGAGLVLDGEIYRGPHTEAGEFGHMILDPAGPPCVCGRRGCVEAQCSPAAVVERYRHASDDKATTVAKPRPWGRRTASELQVLRACAESGDGLAAACLRDAGRLLGIATWNLVELLDVEDVILSGPGLELMGKLYMNGVKAGFVSAGLRSRRKVRLATSKWQAASIALGSALLVLGQEDF
jgi:predicted NBD/HSP70 family sugar kinase